MLPALVRALHAGQSFALSSSGAQNWDYLYAADAADADVFSLQPSVEKICRDTGWQPMTDFVDGLRCGYGILP